MPKDATLAVCLYKNPDEQLATGCQALLRVSNHHDVERVLPLTGAETNVAITVHDNLFDHYSIIVSVDGFRQFGAFYRAQAAALSTFNVLLIPARPTLTFSTWDDIKSDFPDAARVLSMGFSGDAAAQHYDSLVAAKPLSLACLLNLVAAMKQIKVAGSQTPLNYLRGVMWDDSLAQDRFFGYADPELIALLESSSQRQAVRQRAESRAVSQGSDTQFQAD